MLLFVFFFFLTLKSYKIQRNIEYTNFKKIYLPEKEYSKEIIIFYFS